MVCLIVMLIENWCSMHSGWFRMKDDRFLTSPPLDSSESSKNFLQKMATKNSGIWTEICKKSQGQPRYPRWPPILASFLYYSPQSQSAPINGKASAFANGGAAARARGVEGGHRVESDSILTHFPETNSSFTPWKWLVGIRVSFLGWPIFRGFRECRNLVNLVMDAKRLHL